MSASRSAEPGTIVALTGCAAWRDGDELTVSGLYRIECFEPCDPAAFVPEAGWLVAHVDADPDDDEAVLFIGAYDLWQQTDPQGYGRYLADEREQALAEP